MVMFSPTGQIMRYESELDILKEFFTIRSERYSKRKEYMLARLKRDYEIAANKVQFVEQVINNSIQITKVKR